MQIRIFCLPIFEAMFFTFISAYLKHWVTAHTRHGTHSPFVYKLADEVIYDFSAKKVYQKLAAQRKKLLDDDSILLHDINSTSQQQLGKVRALAKKTIKSNKLLQLLFRLAADRQPKEIVVIDNSFGLEAACLALACPDAHVVAIMAHAAMATLAASYFSELGLTNIEVRLEEFSQTLAQVQTLEMVVLNGYTDEATFLSYFELCLSKADANSMLIFDQPHQNKSIQQAWAFIKQRTQVTVTIDLFFLGLVYFRHGQAKENFKLKFKS